MPASDYANSQGITQSHGCAGSNANTVFSQVGSKIQYLGLRRNGCFFEGHDQHLGSSINPL